MVFDFYFLSNAFGCTSVSLGASLVVQMVKNLPAMQDTWVQSLDREDLMEEEMATHSSILAWKIPLTDTGYSPWSREESDRTERLTLCLT